MNNLQKFMDRNRTERIERVLNEPIRGLLARRSTRRALAVAAVLASWTYFIALLIPNDLTNVPELIVKGYIEQSALLIMLSTYALMRKAVRRITTLPDRYLDELQIQNRDWAFSLGYLIVRRVGLTITIAFVLFSIASSLANRIHNLNNPNQLFDPVMQSWQLWIADYIKSYFEVSPLTSAANIIILLTYVAYSFPIILLTWRESSRVEDNYTVTNYPASLLRVSRGYFVRLTILGVAIAISLVGLPLGDGRVKMFILGNMLVPTIVYALYVYAWGLSKQWLSFNELSAIGTASNFQNDAKSVKRLFFLTAGLGLSIGLSMFSVFFGYWLFRDLVGWLLLYSIIAGIILAIIHAIAFTAIDGIGQRAISQVGK